MDSNKKRLLIETAERLDDIAGGLDPRGFCVENVEVYPEGQLMKEIRTFINYPQKELAPAIGISAPSLSAHEKRQSVNNDIMSKFYNATQIDPWNFDVIRNALSILKIDLNTLMDNPNKAIEELQRRKKRMEELSRQAVTEGITHRISELSTPSIMKVLDYVRLLQLAEEEDKKPS